MTPSCGRVVSPASPTAHVGRATEHRAWAQGIERISVTLPLRDAPRTPRGQGHPGCLKLVAGAVTGRSSALMSWLSRLGESEGMKRSCFRRRDPVRTTQPKGTIATQINAVRYHGPGRPFVLQRVPLPEPGLATCGCASPPPGSVTPSCMSSPGCVPGKRE